MARVCIFNGKRLYTIYVGLWLSYSSRTYQNMENKVYYKRLNFVFITLLDEDSLMFITDFVYLFIFIVTVQRYGRSDLISPDLK